MKRPFVTVGLPVSVAILLAGNWLTYGGSLTPPVGPVAGTMKPLSDVEPRIAINATNTPGDADSLFKITQPGSYYLTGNIQGVAAKHGIEIVASGVTLDLMGFDLLGVAGSLDGVSDTGGSLRNIAVVNGSVRSWGGDGVDLLGFAAINCRVADLLASGNTGNGIGTGSDCTVTNCSAYLNTGRGISTNAGCTVSNCTACDNTGSGISVNSGSTVADCTARINTLDGIVCTSSCVIRGNTCSFNGNGGDGAGIHATDGDNRIEGNHCTGADRGLDIDGTNNYIADNTVRGNTDNYAIVAGNQLNLLLGQIPESIDWPATVTLAGTLTGVSGQNGITINSDNVTIDLAGHALVGVGGSLKGIAVPAARSNLAVLNGSVRSWGGDGVDLGTFAPINCRVADLIVRGNTGNGMLVGAGSTVSKCSANQNGGTGISTSYGCTVSNCSANQNTDTGINTNIGCTVSNCSAYSNTVKGISVSGGSTVSNCSASANFTGIIITSTGCTVSNCSAYSNTDIGIFVVDGSTVANCTARLNTLDGILCTSSCVIRGNTCASNGNGGDGAGIHATGNDNRIEGNNCVNADRGLDIDGTNNYIADNTVRGNTDNYDIAAGNQLNILLCQIPESIDWPATVTLAGTLTGISSQNGITINSDNVTIDLAGHALVGVGGSLKGISVPAAHSSLAIRNGTVRTWGGDGVDAFNAANSRLEGIRASNNGGDGLRTGYNSTVVGCSALNNTGDGIELQSQGVVTECAVNGNTGTGILASDSSEISNCSVVFNAVDGIRANTGSSIRRCTVRGNAGDGIEVSLSCVVVENLCDFNGNGGDGAGIHVLSASCRIDSNNVIGADRGIDVDGANNLIIRNSATANTTNYDIVANNKVGFIVAAPNSGAISGSTGGAGVGTTDPWANVSY